MFPLAGRLEVLARENRRYNRIVRGSYSKYVAYLGRADVEQLWDLGPTEECEPTCSIAAVGRRSGKGLRKICMVCPFNAAGRPLGELLGHEPECGMLAGGAVTQVAARHGYEIGALDAPLVGCRCSRGGGAGRFPSTAPRQVP